MNWTLLRLRGRASREEYGQAGMAYSLGAGFAPGVAGAVILWLLSQLRLINAVTLSVVGTGVLAVMALFVAASFAAGVRRMHDLGHSGGWVALIWVGGLAGLPMIAFQAWWLALPVVAALIAVGWLLLAKGDAGANRYGEAPAPTAATVPPVAQPAKSPSLDEQLSAARRDLDAAKISLRRQRG